MTSPLARTIVLAAVTVSIAACSDSSAPDNTPASVVLVSGNTQSGTVAQALGSPLTVRVENAAGDGLQGVTVNWAITAGGGSVPAAPSQTDADGEASVVWTLGTAAGASNTATASVAALPGDMVSFTATAMAGPPTQLIQLTGNNQSGTAGALLAQPLFVLVRDQYDNPAPQATVDWDVTAGNGTVSSASTLSDATGAASVTWTLGTIAGPNVNRVTTTLRAIIGPSRTFTASGVAGSAALLGIVSGDEQSALADDHLHNPLVVVSTDQHGNPVAGATVNWAVATGGGSISAASNVTASNGRASVTWRLGTTPGPDNNSVTATVAGIPASLVTFTATALPLPPSSLTILSGAQQSGEAATVLPIPLTVALRDRLGGPIAGRTVNWTAEAGQGSVAVVNAITDAEGKSTATFTLGLIAGSNTASATIPNLFSVQFHFSVRPGAPRRIVILSGAGQQAPPGDPLPAPLRVRVTDTLGNSINGVTVDWSVVTGGGTIATPSSVTAGSEASTGTTTNQWTLGSALGTQRVSAQITAFPSASVDFDATSSPGGTISGVISVADGALLAAGRGVRIPGAPRAAALSTAVRRPRAAKPAQATAMSALKRVPTARPARAQEYVADELIVTWQTGAVAGLQPATLARSGVATANSVATQMRARLAAHERGGRLRVLGASPLVRATRVRVTNPSTIDSVASALRAEPGVARVERNRIARLAYKALPRRRHIASNDPFYPFQAWQYSMIDLPDAWALTKGSPAVLVAVVDDGIVFDHPDINGNLTNDGYDFVSSVQGTLCAGGTVDLTGDGDGVDPNPSIPIAHLADPVLDCVTGPAPTGGHGLHVAGTVGAIGSNGAGVSGVAQIVRLRPIRVLNTLGRGTTYDIAQGTLYAAGLPADNGAGGTVQAPSRASIINMSIGGGESQVLHDAVVQATAAGSLIIASAGNSATSTPSFPAAHDEVISVSAVGPDGLLASYSNFGPTIDIAAPGGDFEDGDCTFGVVSTLWDFQNNRAGYACAEGTSMAAPHVAGVAALMLARTPGLSSAELRSRLLAWAVDRGAPGRDDQYGAGILNARNSLTQSFAPPRQLFAQLYNATTGAIVGRVPTQPGGAFTFSAIVGGTYHVYAGEDVNGDGRIGVAGRRWGAFGGSAVPAGVTVQGVSAHDATFSIGAPTELEPNDTRQTANALPFGGYMTGSITPETDGDYYRLVISQRAKYRVETSDVAGACGFTLEEDTILTLFDANGAQIVENDDIAPEIAWLCSRVDLFLDPGVYFVRITGYFGGRYRVSASLQP